MNKLIQGLEILRTYILTSDLETSVYGETNAVIVKPTNRQVPFNAVRVLIDLGWKQDGAGGDLVVGAYDRDKPWIFFT